MIVVTGVSDDYFESVHRSLTQEVLRVEVS